MTVKIHYPPAYWTQAAPLPPPAQRGDDVIVTPVHGAPRDRGQYLGRDSLVAFVRSSRDDHVRIWPLVRFLVQAATAARARQ